MDLFTNDFPNALKAAEDTDIKRKDDNSVVLHIRRQVYMDFPAKTKFVGFYIPAPDPTDSLKSLAACKMLADFVQATMDDMPKKLAVSGGYRGEMTSAEDLTFSGRVVLYHGGPSPSGPGILGILEPTKNVRPGL